MTILLLRICIRIYNTRKRRCFRDSNLYLMRPRPCTTIQNLPMVEPALKSIIIDKEETYTWHICHTLHLFNTRTQHSNIKRSLKNLFVLYRLRSRFSLHFCILTRSSDHFRNIGGVVIAPNRIFKEQTQKDYWW